MREKNIFIYSMTIPKQPMAPVEENATKKEDASVDELWTILKSGIREGIANNIPHKMLRSKGNIPWVTSSIRQLIRQRDRPSRRYRILQNDRDS